MQDEYDFSRGVRGKHYKKYREAHNVIINVEDYDMMVEVLDRLIDEVGEDENHPLIAFVDYLGIVIKKYEDENIPEITEL